MRVVSGVRVAGAVAFVVLDIDSDDKLRLNELKLALNDPSVVQAVQNLVRNAQGRRDGPT